MRKFIYFFLFSLSLLGLACTPKVAAVIGQDGTDWNARAESYRNNPAALQALVEECEATEARANQLQSDVNRLQSGQSNYQSAQQEITNLRQQLANSQAQLTTAQNALANRDEIPTDQAMVSGVIFRVQLGAFAEAQNQINNDMATGDALDLQNQNGLQKVVVAQYRTYTNAQKLRDRLRKMGAKDAFIVAFQDGRRIETSEALRVTGQG